MAAAGTTCAAASEFQILDAKDQASAAWPKRGCVLPPTGACAARAHPPPPPSPCPLAPRERELLGLCNYLTTNEVMAAAATVMQQTIDHIDIKQDQQQLWHTPLPPSERHT